MQANAPVRTIQVSMDTFAAIWADRRAGENSEDAILRRKFNIEAAPTNVQEVPPPENRRPAPSAPVITTGGSVCVSRRALKSSAPTKGRTIRPRLARALGS
jgi:hypothetical protein